MNWARTGLFALTVAVLSLALIIIGGLSRRQGVVVGLLVALLRRDINRAVRKPTSEFQPFYVWVKPDWPELLNDYHLLVTNTWKEIAESLDNVAVAEYRVLRSGLYFTVLRANEDPSPALIYWDNTRRFSTELKFDAEITPIRIEREDNAGGILSQFQKVEFFFRQVGLRLEIGINVPDWWWNKVRDLCPTPVSVEGDAVIGYEKLVLAEISIREFDLYWKPREWTSHFLKKTIPETVARLNNERVTLGWVEDSKNPIPGAGTNWLPTRINHRYFEVWHRRV